MSIDAGVQPRSGDATDAVNSGDGGAVVDAGDTKAPSDPWPDAASCSFPMKGEPSEGQRREQCCHPARDVELCLGTMSLTHFHQVASYTHRGLTIRRRDQTWRYPLDRQAHGSMRYPDEVFAKLSFKVLSTGLELRVREGCRGLCSGERCSAEQKTIAKICSSAGDYVWDDERGLVPK